MPNRLDELAIPDSREIAIRLSAFNRPTGEIAVEMTSNGRSFVMRVPPDEARASHDLVQRIQTCIRHLDLAHRRAEDPVFNAQYEAELESLGLLAHA